MGMKAVRVVRILLCAVLGLVLLPALPGHPTAAAEGPPQPAPRFAPGEILVAFEPGAMTAQSTQALLDRYTATPIRALYGSAVQVVQVPEGRELAISRALDAEAGIRYAEPNYVYSIQGVPNDPGFSGQWAYTNIRAAAAWDITTGSSTVVIAVVDTGVDTGHPDLASKLVSGWDFVSNDPLPNDENGHGTHVAGIAAAITNNGIGVAGMAWGARIMPVRALNAAGEGYASQVASAIDWARNSGAKIINLSLGGPDGAATLQDAITRAHNAGILVVAAMGNGGTATPYYPAANAHVMAVAATDQNDVRASYSNYGTHSDIAAPGGQMQLCHQATGILSTLPTYDAWLTVPNPTGCTYYKGYDTMKGTSQATPFVSGLAALMWSVDPTLTPDQVQQAIQNTATDLGTAGWDELYGHGRIDALAALDLARRATPEISPIANSDGNGDYVVEWTGVSYATSYELQEDDNSGFTSPTTVYNGAARQFTVTNKPPGQWYYRVRAVRSSTGLYSPWSTTQTVAVGLAAPSLLPINNDGADSYSVTWQPVTGATGYRLQESAYADFAGATTYDVGSSLFLNIVGRDGGSWYYRVQAYNTGGASPWSAVQSATVIPDPPALNPIATTAEPDAYTLSWSAAVGATAYRLEEAADAAFTAPVTRYLGVLTNYPVTGQPGGTWYYRVRAVNAAGASPPSNTRSFTVTVPTIPAPTLQPIVDPDHDTIYTAQWTAVPTATGYLLEMSGSPYFVGATLYYSGALTQVTVTDHLAGTRYYRVRAQTGVGKSPWSNSQSILITARIYIPMVVRNSVQVTANSGTLGDAMTRTH